MTGIGLRPDIDTQLYLSMLTRFLLKRVLLVGILVQSVLCSSAQQYAISGEVMLCTYNMKNLSDFMTNVSIVSGVPLQIVDNFPAHPGYQFTLGYQKDPKFMFGGSLGYFSGKGRSYYEDGSSSAEISQQAAGYSAAAFFSYQVNESEVWPLFVRFSASYVFNTLDLAVYERQGSSVDSESFNFISSNFAFRPAIGLQRNVTEKFFVTLQAGYEFHFPGNFNSIGGTQTVLKAEWDGLRAVLGVGLKVGSTKELDYY